MTRRLLGDGRDEEISPHHVSTGCSHNQSDGVCVCIILFLEDISHRPPALPSDHSWEETGLEKIHKTRAEKRQSLMLISAEPPICPKVPPSQSPEDPDTVDHPLADWLIDKRELRAQRAQLTVLKYWFKSCSCFT